MTKKKSKEPIEASSAAGGEGAEPTRSEESGVVNPEQSPVEPREIEGAPKTELIPPPGAADSPLASGGRPMPSQPRTFVSRVPAKAATSEEPKAVPSQNTPATAEPDKPRTVGAPASKPRAAKTTGAEKSPTPRSSFPAAAGAAGAASGEPRSADVRGGKTEPARSAPAGGDTVRLRVNPSQRAKTSGGTFPTSAVPRPARRLPDIRRRQAAPAATPHYGPFSLFFGFIWLIFKMLFFSALVMGLAAATGYAVMHWYIRTETVTVPNVRGMKVSEAFDVLSEKKLGMIKVRSESSGLVAPGEIIEQNPQAGSSAKEGRAVGVVVSSGRSRYMVPNVVGESIDNARNKIKGAGLEVGNELRLEDPNVPKEAVISQQPAPNTGTDDPVKVDLLVSSGPPGKSLTMPELTGRTLAEAKAALSRLGITDITVQPPDAAADATILTQEPLVGKSIFQTDRVTLTTR